MPVLDGLVEAGFPEWAEQFDFGAKVHDDLEVSGLGAGALSVPFAILEFTDIFVPIGKGEGTNTISPRVAGITAGALGQTPRFSRTE